MTYVLIVLSLIAALVLAVWTVRAVFAPIRRR